MSKVTFNNSDHAFYASLKAAVNSYFTNTAKKKTGNIHLYIKTVILILAAISLYTILLFLPMSWLPEIVCSLVMGFILACIGFNVMHDANHGSYSSSKRVNELLGLTLNALGGNNFIWKQKHNIVHHTYTNIDGIDDDIAKSPFIRMCGSQPWVPAHRLQHLYTPLLYAVSSMIWILYQDFDKYFKKRIIDTPLSRMSAADHWIFWISKALYLLFYIGIPVLLMGWQSWLLFYLSLNIGLGFTLSIVFQLAHVVEVTEFDAVSHDEKQIENEWAIHQVRTTANFSPDRPILSWFVGGLNYQVEHHLFPRISHIHYPALSALVQKECADFDLPYNSLPSFRAAVISHFRFIRILGKKPLKGL
ncbi:MAG: acyl-CoA desaturase [Bacteroidetes bacterium]|nr:acyl-CoA desaturase [Bacteroidota bacterium]